MEWDLGPVEDQEQLVLARVEARQQAVEGDEPGASLEDALLLLIETSDGPRWTFKHPTIGDAFAALVAESPELTEIYLRGARFEQLLREVVCSGINIEGAAVHVPLKLYPLLLDRITAKPIDYAVRYFLSQRCDLEFLRLVIARVPALLDLTIHPFMAYSSETQLLARLHELGLLPEDKRQRFGQHVGELTVSTPDGAVLRDDGLRSLFTDEEFAGLLDRIRSEVVDRLDDLVTDWRWNCRSDEDPESYFDEFESMLQDIEQIFEEDDETVGKVQEGRSMIKSAIESLNADREEPRSERVETPTGQISETAGRLRSIFDDIDQ